MGASIVLANLRSILILWVWISPQLKPWLRFRLVLLLGFKLMEISTPYYQQRSLHIFQFKCLSFWTILKLKIWKLKTMSIQQWKSLKSINSTNLPQLPNLILNHKTYSRARDHPQNYLVFSHLAWIFQAQIKANQSKVV